MVATFYIVITFLSGHTERQTLADIPSKTRETRNIPSLPYNQMESRLRPSPAAFHNGSQSTGSGHQKASDSDRVRTKERCDR